MSNTKVPEQLVLGNAVDYKKVCHIHPGKYVHLQQEDELQNTINIDRSVGAIVLGTQLNLQGGNVFRAF